MTPEVALLIIRILLAIVLYAFLFVVLRTQWADLRTSRLRQPRAPAARLQALDSELVEGIFPLDQANEIGRAADNLIRLEDETVSAHHARLMFHAGQWWLEDLGSRNGTSVNGLSLEEPLVVTYGDEISFGRVRMRLEDGIESAETEASSRPA